MKTEQLNIRVPEDLKQEFDNKCKDNLQSSSAVIRKLMELYIEKGMKLYEEDK